jgi:hypothetical protein
VVLAASRTLDIIAILAGTVAVISAIAGVLLAIRAARTKERRAAAAEIQELSEMLAVERDARIRTEKQLFDAHVLLAQHGLDHDDPH